MQAIRETPAPDDIGMLLCLHVESERERERGRQIERRGEGVCVREREIQTNTNANTNYVCRLTAVYRHMILYVYFQYSDTSKSHFEFT